METRRLERSRTDRMLFGVCGGLARYFDVDSTLIRLIFLLFTFVGGSGVIVYIILAIVMPPEGSPTREPRDVVRENISEIGSTARDVSEQLRTSFGRGKEEGEVTEGETTGAVRHTRDRQATTGLILVALGALFLLSNLGILSWVNWGRLWPLVLIGIGLAILWRREGR